MNDYKIGDKVEVLYLGKWLSGVVSKLGYFGCWVNLSNKKRWFHWNEIKLVI